MEISLSRCTLRLLRYFSIFLAYPENLGNSQLQVVIRTIRALSPKEQVWSTANLTLECAQVNSLTMVEPETSQEHQITVDILR